MSWEFILSLLLIPNYSPERATIILENVKPKIIFSFIFLEPGITSGLSDIYALRGQPADLTIKMNVDADGAWFKDGEQVMLYYIPYLHHTLCNIMFLS